LKIAPADANLLDSLHDLKMRPVNTEQIECLDITCN
jgi:hypothetical protein